jgi:hypothetical protein
VTGLQEIQVSTHFVIDQLESSISLTEAEMIYFIL